MLDKLITKTEMKGKAALANFVCVCAAVGRKLLLLLTHVIKDNGRTPSKCPEIVHFGRTATRTNKARQQSRTRTGPKRLVLSFAVATPAPARHNSVLQTLHKSLTTTDI